MTSQITASDITNWDSLDDIAESLLKRGLDRNENLSDNSKIVLQLSDNEFIELIKARPGESFTDHQPSDSIRRHTNLVATSDFEEFAFITRRRRFDQAHGQIKHQKLSFTKSQFKSESGEKHSILEKLNTIEYGKPATIYDYLYDTKKIVKEFYEQFEELRTDLVLEVAGIPDDAGDAKQRYVQVILDRMIFLYFIQAKRLLHRNPDYLHEHQAKVIDNNGDVYEEFYKPLFFELLAEGVQDPDFGSLPYLNGGLFTKNQVEVDYPDARLGKSTEDTNALFDRILDFLSDWNWNVDERLDIVDPKNLSPAVLGHIFEQSVNQKEMGAYYTPEEITGFMARRSIHPYLLDQLNEAVGANYEEIDEVFALEDHSESFERGEAVADGGTFTQQAATTDVQADHVESLYFDILQDTRVLDPAVGSGAFLLAAQEVLLDVYLQCLEFFEQVEREGNEWKLANKTRELLERLEEAKGTNKLHAKRAIILNNLYGVDIDEGAVEICKLRLWLSMVADIEDEPGEVEPLPNIDFNIRQGNSLIGFTEDIEINQKGEASLNNYGVGVGDSIKDKLNDLYSAVEKHRHAKSGDDAAKWREEAELRLETYNNDLNKKILKEFREAGIDDVTIDEVERHHPFHWVLEFVTVYEDGGFDIIIGNPPWDVVAPNRDDYFSKFDELFRTRGPSDKDNTKQKLLEDPSIADGWQKYQDEMEVRAAYFNGTPHFRLQDPQLENGSVGNENDLSLLFLERVCKIAKENSYIAQILPGTVFVGAAGKDLRSHLLNQTKIHDLIVFQNEGIFEDLHQQYKFGVLTFRNSGNTDSLKSKYQRGDVKILENIDDAAVEVPRKVLTQYSPDAEIFPLIESDAQVEVLKKIIEHPPLGDSNGSWYINPYSELHRNGDRDRYLESKKDGDYPVYGGSNIYQYEYSPDFIKDLESPTLWSVDENKDPNKSAKRRIREKAFRSRDPEMSLKKAIYQTFGGSGSQKKFANTLLEKERGKPLSFDDVKLDCSEYRIVFRNITNSTNERTMICSVIPKGVVCHHAINTIRPFTIDISRDDLTNDSLHSAYERVFTDKELFAALGLLNSIPFDFLMRTKIEENLVMYKLTESQVPRLTEGDDWFDFISHRAARLNCYGDEFEEMRQRLGDLEPATDLQERNEIRAEIDAAAFHAYGLTQDDVKFILDTFHTVKSPRIMTNQYLDSVLRIYQELSKDNPKK